MQYSEARYGAYIDMSTLFGFLYARPSFREGVARVLDMGDTLTEYNYSLTPQQADRLALRSDWMVVGEDLRHAMIQAARELRREDN